MTAARSTIFALSSGRPPAAIAVVRISGPEAAAALQALIGRLPEPRKATLARLRDPRNGEVIDEALALWFPAPRSETGQDTVELQLHGGQAVIAGVLDALSTIDGCRLAEPGEFTRRAFENGRLDLTAVEGLADLIAAQTPAQRRLAFRQLKGLIGDRAEDWRRRLTEALALVEARIDFSDEADVPEDLVRPALAAAQRLRAEVAASLADGGRGERLREGLVVAIAGPTNAGKSALLNRLARREAAIVSPHPGTTRDVIEVHLDLAGYPVTLLDTAGIRDSDDPVEREGVRRARARAATADLVLWVTDASVGDGRARAGQDGPKAFAAEVWWLRNKADLFTDVAGASEESRCKDNKDNHSFTISARTGCGMDRLVAALAIYAKDYFATTESALITRERHRCALQETVAALDRALAHHPLAHDPLAHDPLAHDYAANEELIADDLRAAAMALGRLTGRVDVEDILDVIFRDFCIGK